MNKFTSRKFNTMIGCIALFTYLLIQKHLTPDTYQVLLMVILPAYFITNVAEKSRVAD